MKYQFTMRRIAFIFFILGCLSLAAKAQQLHFIYLQADNKIPFSVKLNGKYYSSSSIGYLIIPKLADGTYTFQVGFAQNSFPEQAFTLNVMGKDYGFALKNFDAKNWELFNFQTTDVVMNNAAPPPQKPPAAVANNTSAFGNMLANVINDSTINNVSAADTISGVKQVVATPVAAAPDTAKTVAVTATIATATAAAKEVVPANKEVTAHFDTTVENTAVAAATGVIKAWENTSDKGTDLMFIDFTGTHNDTINAFIPAVQQQAVAQKDTTTIPANNPAADTAKKSSVSNPFFNQNNSSNNTSSSTTVAQPNLIGDSAATVSPATKNIVTNSCANMLSDGDLNKLKKKIISQTSQDAALATVRKTLRERCIATAQVKDLGNLFLNDESRYGFYDAVYSFVADINNYAALESTLIDPYFKTRFKALLR